MPSGEGAALFRRFVVVFADCISEGAFLSVYYVMYPQVESVHSFILESMWCSFPGGGGVMHEYDDDKSSPRAPSRPFVCSFVRLRV